MKEGLLGLLLHLCQGIIPKNNIPKFKKLTSWPFSWTTHNHFKVQSKRLLELLFDSTYLNQLAFRSASRRLRNFKLLLAAASLICLALWQSLYGSLPNARFHSVVCTDVVVSFCLCEANAIQELMILMDDENVDVQLASVEALLTLNSQHQTSEKARLKKLKELWPFKEAILLFQRTCSGELRKRVAFDLTDFCKRETG
ncbi:hypothetical protein MA16_Dca002768 [Dendrobium catenatum]|uniref:Uncharacterized protein n=1 Tax=Dendrobium catenatum TaxID=906689 RepID=A0A2I0X8L4_9ASPA|nr:hypothetical protein MA16_Dca002768 [Dendrobium catenatum]